MKRTMTVEIPEDILRALNRRAKDEGSRSQLVEEALMKYLRLKTPEERAKRDRREIEIMNKHAAELNAEAEDCLQYQIEL